MSHHKSHAASAPSEPRRTLGADFTVLTLRHATTAKRRANTKQQIRAIFKEPFSMKSLNFLRTVPGAAIAIVVISTTSVSAYALTNWFNGTVRVKQDSSILSVDLSPCKGNMPPGIEPSTDRSKVQFKILGNPHIAAKQLQQQLLAECEYNAVIDFYRNNPEGKNYALYPSTIKAVNGDRVITLDYFWGGKLNEKTFSDINNASVYDQGNKASLQDLRPGDTIIFAVDTPTNTQEGIDPLAGVGKVASIFKTQYDTKTAPGATKKAFYPESNIMPLTMYEQLHK
ncbi:MAG TPA: hypothetical protein VJ836_04105 [Candidatus Saccharimonadales bacterium]|nr:hypothetical protein [Candidatus Saccharimonadales bacterium]